MDVQTEGITDATRDTTWLTPGEIAASLGVHRSTVIRWVDSGLVEGFRTPGGRVKIRRSDADRILQPISPAA